MAAAAARLSSRALRRPHSPIARGSPGPVARGLRVIAPVACGLQDPITGPFEGAFTGSIPAPIAVGLPGHVLGLVLDPVPLWLPGPVLDHAPPGLPGPILDPVAPGLPDLFAVLITWSLTGHHSVY